MLKSNKLRIIPLGGLNEIGKNITLIECDNDIVICDCGMTFPEDEMLGVDIVIPDITYLEKNKERIRGIVLTHGHEDHIGAIPYVLKKINVPIYGTRLTLGLLENKLKEHNLKPKMHVVNFNDKVRLGKIVVEFIRQCHSIPDSAALAFHTPAGVIVHTGDFKIDFTPIMGGVNDLNRFAELGDKGVLCLLAESTNVERKGYTLSERVVGETFRTIFHEYTENRIIVATFASNMQRIQQIIEAAEKHGRKIVLSGRSMINNVKVAKDLGYLRVKDSSIIDINKMNKYDDSEICIITTGSQGEPMSALTRIAYNEHRKIQLTPNDLIILSAHPIPGNENAVSKVINKLIELDAKVIYESLGEIHVSGHACQEELKLIHSLLKPRYFIPVHGEQRHLKLHAQLAESMGMNPKNIFIMNNGEVLELDKRKAEIVDEVTSGNVLVDGLGVGDVGNIVLRDRKHLSEDGLIIVVLTLSKEDGSTIAGPDIISRGFVYVREADDLMEEAKKKVVLAIEDCQRRNIKDWSSIKNAIRDSLKKYIYQTMKRNPMILPVIMEV
ncbi:MAG: ribonuclease J [Eubacteriales bacterium]|uniref:ribonuclease J n=1 Tax=Fenollaria sp. TaxID=1965292 RepID=UPI002A760897|nr:ribonuclease J [Fenollaria sp.]MDD7339059.1 ribonuclease J [Eubacteriales bacterium]MDY3106462.1 ribonuclease J [Fenollaria sp.]